jgi:hypothetical protein
MTYLKQLSSRLTRHSNFSSYHSSNKWLEPHRWKGSSPILIFKPIKVFHKRNSIGPSSIFNSLLPTLGSNMDNPLLNSRECRRSHKVQASELLIRISCRPKFSNNKFSKLQWRFKTVTSQSSITTITLGCTMGSRKGSRDDFIYFTII